MKPRTLLWGGLALMAILTTVFWATDLDLKWCAAAYSPTLPHWPLARTTPCLLIHWMNAWPGVALLAGAILGWIASVLRPSLLAWRRPCLFVMALVALGPGLLINGIFKPLMSRPRPYETVFFGGIQPFLRPFQPGVPFHGSSFMSGHASMAFIFMGLFFVLKGPGRWAALSGGILFGALVGFVRVIRGDHFPSDILLAGALVFNVAAALSMMDTPSQAALPTPGPADAD